MAYDKGLTEIARKYVKAFPEIKGDRTLARKLYQENKDTFTSLEHARRAVRYIRGHVGAANRNDCADKSDFKPLTHDSHPTKNKMPEKTHARILVLDIETAPIAAFVFQVWKTNVGHHQIITDWFMLTWSAKWLFEKKVLSDRLTSNEAKKQNDKRIVKSLWALLDEADIIIAHNGDKFDIPSMNTRFLIHRIPPPSPYQSIDTLKTFQKQFKMPHNKLDYVSQLLAKRKKIHTDFELWRDCYNGLETALVKMERYNIHDVRILEDVYIIIRPWIKPHPNMALFILDYVNRCPSCGSGEIKMKGTYRTYANNFEAFSCTNCGAVGRMRKSSVNVKEKQYLTMSVPK